MTAGRDRTAGPHGPPPTLDRLWDRRAAFTPFAVAGAASVVAGGLVAAAIAAPAPTRHGVWAVAYLVLVLGVSQIALGAGHALLPETPPEARRAVVIAAVFNVANVGVLAGVITGQRIVLGAGCALLVVALGLLLYAVRHGAGRGWALSGYRLIVAVLAVSVPIGLFLSTVGSP